MHCKCGHPNTIVIVALAMLMVIVPVTSAFNGIGSRSTGSSMGSLGQESQSTTGLQPTNQNLTEPSSALETPSSSSQVETISDGNPPLPTPDLSPQTLSEQAGSIKRQPPQPPSVQLPPINPSEQVGTIPSSPSN